jgi:hypothetical protein
MSQPQPRDSASGQQRYNINRQDAGVINNVGRNQHNSYVQQVHERESFLRAIAATRTKARWLVWTGLALFVVGFGLFAAGVLGFLTQAAKAVSSGNVGPPADPFGRDVGGIPSGLLGWAIAAVGMVLIVVGIVLHVVATSRRRRVDRELPLAYPAWPAPGQWR